MNEIEGMTAMKTLVEFDQERRRVYQKAEDAIKPHPNGIECPKCKKELHDSAPTVTLTSNPPQKNVHCPACGYRGFRIA